INASFKRVETSINNLVDIGNYVMMETGQPLHVYDAAQLPNQILEATVLTEKTAFLPLSKDEEVKEMQVPENTIVIKSGEEIVSVAGLIGGKKSSVSENTTSILIEAANFDLISLRKAQANLNLYTEASKRFSRGVDLALSRYGLARYLHLLSDNLGAELSFENYGYTEVLAAESFKIEFTAEELNAAVGIHISAEEIMETLGHLAIDCKEVEGTIVATITSYRQDITIKQDIFEEIARLVGYDRMQTTMPTGGLPAHPTNINLKLRETARDALVAAGLQEIMNYSLTQEILEKNLYLADKEVNTGFPFVKMLNPVSVDKTVMRRSLMTGLLTTIEHNIRHEEGLRLFEIGQVFLPQANQKLPNEPYHIAIGLTGTVAPFHIYDKDQRNADFYDLKAAVEFLFQHLHIVIEVSPAENIAPYQNGLCAKITKGEKVYGYMGKIHPLVAKAYNMEGQQIYAAELDFEVILQDAIRDFPFDEYSKFPSMGEDIALIISEKHTAGELQNAIFALNDPLLKAVNIFDEFKDEQIIGKDLRSLGIRLMLNAKTRTLSQDEANASRDAVSTMLAEKFGAIIRK
ncbi:MAG: phenylalanine--tRNA ligase subunit beta, partial [Bacteroidia bacterium]